jgi:hypothetical protein
MPSSEDDDDRRRSPRFTCGGEARIYSLPSDGVHVPGKLRNLSLGGVCLDTTHMFDLGALTEILVSVNAASFRTLGLVKAVERSRASMEFIQMSAGSRDLLADLIAQFERLAETVNRLRSERMEAAEKLQREMENAGVRVARLGSGDVSISKVSVESNFGQKTGQSPERERIIEVQPLVIKVDLFG